MDRENQLQLFKDFIINCTTNANSLKNYIDFKRINECLQQLFPERKDASILDFDDPIAFEKVVNELEGLKTYIDFNAQGKNQYSSTVSWYQRFLNAKHLFSKQKKTVLHINETIALPLQQIFYGAPGTGKSHTVNEITKKQPKENVFRTTFHPDSDYATFVGCYKPTKETTSPLSFHKLHELYPEFKTKVENRPLHRFITKYYNSFRLLTEKEAESVFDKIETTSTVTAEVPKIKAAIEEIPIITSISYSFVPQSFTKAYLRAWQTEEPVYLVIEEINRGNCAQIFGDLFQLLDRNDGVSEYPVDADTDLANFIRTELADSNRTDIPAEVKDGQKLLLPANLYIWATMNTSDQSLFPIDSAFKRRWEWKYIPIDTRKENWTIKVVGADYDWSDFLEKINKKIDSTTHSEDKMLGFYFCKAENSTINAERFVNKVAFYLWNDVFKDYGFDDAIFNDENGEKLSFRKFYKNDGTVEEAKVKTFLDKLGVIHQGETSVDIGEELQ